MKKKKILPIIICNYTLKKKKFQNVIVKDYTVNSLNCLGVIYSWIVFQGFLTWDSCSWNPWKLSHLKFWWIHSTSVNWIYCGWKTLEQLSLTCVYAIIHVYLKCQDWEKTIKNLGPEYLGTDYSYCFCSTRNDGTT